jgi:hypothetical protein
MSAHPDGQVPATRIVREKIETRRLLRALEMAGLPRPSGRPPAGDLKRLLEADGILTQVLEVLERERGRKGAVDGTEFLEFLETVARARSRILETVPPELATSARRHLLRVSVTEPQVWEEVRRFRLDAPARPAAEATDLHVRKAELQPLPGSGEIDPWIERLPTPWLRTVARKLGLPRSRGRAELVEAVAELLRDPVELRGLLRRALDFTGRVALAQVLRRDGFTIGDESSALRDAVELPWDWEQVADPPPIAKLRMLGLVHVGPVAGERAVAVPPELRPLLVAALREVDPDAARGLAPPEPPAGRPRRRHAGSGPEVHPAP